MSGGNFSLYKHTLSQQYCDSNNGDVSSGYVFLDSHTLSQCEDPINFKNIYDDVEKVDGDVSSGYGFKTSTLSNNVNIQVPLIILMGSLTRVMLVVDMVL